MEKSNIAGKVVVITGASSGVGDSTARLLAWNGAKVALGARRKDRRPRGGHYGHKVFALNRNDERLVMLVLKRLFAEISTLSWTGDM